MSGATGHEAAAGLCCLRCSWFTDLIYVESLGE
jgi:hypothetical protein